jgi:hypothetical protein
MRNIDCAAIEEDEDESGDQNSFKHEDVNPN